MTNRSPTPKIRSKAGMWLGLAGSALLILGVFAPLLRMPIIGSVSYIRNGLPQGAAMIAVGAASTVLSLSRAYRWLWLTGFAALAMLAVALAGFHREASALASQARADTVADPFVMMANVAVQSAHYQWGLAILVSGVALILAGAAIRR